MVTICLAFSLQLLSFESGVSSLSRSDILISDIGQYQSVKKCCINLFLLFGSKFFATLCFVTLRRSA